MPAPKKNPMSRIHWPKYPPEQEAMIRGFLAAYLDEAHQMVQTFDEQIRELGPHEVLVNTRAYWDHCMSCIVWLSQRLPCKQKHLREMELYIEQQAQGDPCGKQSGR